jgi:hypothetical protein
MTEKLTDAEIKKALEKEIRLAGYVDSDYCRNIEVSLIKSALDLINRLQAENERLKNAYKQVAWERDCFEADNKRLYEIIENKNIKTEEQ